MGRSFVILEANDQPGGRVHNLRVGPGPDQITEAGAEWVADGQDRILALLKEYGLSTYPTYTTGSSVFYNGTQVYQYSGSIPSGLDPADEAAVLDAVVKLTAMAATVPLDAPQMAPQAAEWDAQTFGQWAKENIATPNAQTLVANSLCGAFGPAPEQQSLLHFLFVAQSAGGPQDLVSTQGALQYRVKGGAASLVQKLSKQMGNRLVVDNPVFKITQSKAGVRLVTAKGTYAASQVIVAMAPPMAGRIVYEPALPVARDQFTQHTPMGGIMKIFTVYPTPFWRDAGLNGMSGLLTGPFAATFDNTPPAGSPGVLMSLVSSTSYLTWASRPQAVRKAAVLDTLGTLFGSAATNPLRYMEFDWPAQQWVRGGATIGVVPLTWTTYGSAWREPIGRIHWAGTEYSSKFNGDMDGAIRSGEQAVNDILS
jgi:monoamine oxidase